MSKTRLSHSASSMFQSCPRKYSYHYLERLRPKNSSSALLFGSAVDSSIQAMLKKESKKSPENIFNYLWNFAEINGEKTYLPTCTTIVYSDSEYDKDLISDDHHKKLEETYGSDWESKLADIRKKKKQVGFKFLSTDEKKLMNHANWTVLHRKGLLMLEAVKKKILPTIQEVLAVQEYVKLQNDNGDSVVGFVDMVAKFFDYEKPIIVDFKTSSIDYEEDSVLNSPQLTLYVHSLSEKYEGTRRAGFIVLHKRIEKNKVKKCSTCGHDGTGQRHKTCNNLVDTHVQGDGNFERCNGAWKETISPEVRIQVITDEIPLQTEKIVLNNFDYINESIKNGIFHRNLQSCIQPWGKCPYFEKCYKDSDEDLIQLTSSKKEN
jgi:hypothetical protein